MFGKKRVMEIIRARHRETPEKILEAIREDIDRFTENAAADDDRTAVIIKRKRHGGHHHGKGAGRGGKGAG